MLDFQSNIYNGFDIKTIFFQNIYKKKPQFDYFIMTWVNVDLQFGLRENRKNMSNGLYNISKKIITKSSR